VGPAMVLSPFVYGNAGKRDTAKRRRVSVWSHRKTEEQEGSCRRNTTVATVCIDRSLGRPATRKELSFRKKFPLPISSLSQVCCTLVFIYLSLSFTIPYFSSDLILISFFPLFISTLRKQDTGYVSVSILRASLFSPEPP
jgi:hypothetical protein